MKTGKITYISPSGQWNGLEKYKVSFADGNQYTFFAKGNFKFNKGDEIKYEITNEEYKNARIPQDQYKEEPAQTNNVKFVDKNDLIIRQTCVKASSELNANKGTDVNKVLNDAQLMFNWIKG